MINEVIKREYPSLIGTHNGYVPTGRRKIYCLYEEVNSENIIEVINNGLAIHSINANEIQMLMDYYKGKHNIFNRKKLTQEDIDNKVVVNYAYSFTRAIVGYTFGKPMQYVARRTDNGEDGENIKEEFRKFSFVNFSNFVDLLHFSLCYKNQWIKIHIIFNKLFIHIKLYHSKSTTRIKYV